MANPLYHTADLGRSKAELAQRELPALNPGGRYLPLTRRLASAWLDEQVARAGLVLDCSDKWRPATPSMPPVCGEGSP